MAVAPANTLSFTDLWSLFDRTGFAISRLRSMELAKSNLTIEQASILFILINSPQGYATPAQLEEITMRQHHSISMLIKGMSKSGTVSKVKFDGRRLKIMPTEAGLNRYWQTTVTSIEESFSVLNAEEWKQFSDIFNKILFKSRALLNIKGSGIIDNKNQKGTCINGISVQGQWALLERTRFACSRIRELELSAFGVSLEQTSILNIIQNNGGSITAKELQDFTMRKQNSISSLINGMIKMGLLAKAKHPGEKRFNIKLTPQGQELLVKLIPFSIGQVFSALDETELAELGHLLEKLLERARYLLGIPYQSPFLQYLIDGKTKIIVS
jgi:DNA-binding MarR family transcriptional regulator